MEENINLHQAKVFGIGGNDEPSQNFPKYDKKVCIYWDHMNLNNPAFKDADIRIHIQTEPEAYRRLSPTSATNDLLLQNQDLFDIILTWDPILLEQIPHTKPFPFGTCWVDAKHEFRKEFALSFLPGAKRMDIFPGHRLRYEVLPQLNNLITASPNNVITNNGLKYDLFPPTSYLPKKDPIFDGYQFSVIVENCSTDNWFTEKLIDCIASKTIPLYCGAPNIGEYFNIDGIISFSSWPELYDIINNLTPETYDSMKEAIEDNYKRHFQYSDFWERVRNEVKELL